MINRRYSAAATPENARSILLHAPMDSAARVRFLAEIQNLPVRVDAGDALVIVNSRTGSVVMNRHVTLESCAVAQGDLSVEVSRTNQVSQPDTPFGGGQTVVTQETQVSLTDKGGALHRINTSADLNNVIRTLNSLGATPNDLMSILQSMKSAGCLRARLEIN